jgi:hypothetical protein
MLVGLVLQLVDRPYQLPERSWSDGIFPALKIFIAHSASAAFCFLITKQQN